MHSQPFPESYRRFKATAAAVGLAALLALAGCGDEGGSSSGGSGGGGAPPIDLGKLTPSCFVGGETPLIDENAPDPTWTYNDPHVLKVNGKYWMYASSTVAFDFPVRIYRLTSIDNVTYTRQPAAPILEPDTYGTWDGGGVETPAVVKFNGKYHMFWTGYPEECCTAPPYDVADFRIGHATSTDGVNWTRNPGNPIVAPSGDGDDGDMSNDWYAFIVGEPGPVVYKNKIYLYFTAVGVSYDLLTSLQVIGVTTSSNGTTWSTPELALVPDQDLFPRDEDWIGYSTPNAIVLKNQVHLFYDVAHQPDGGDWKQWRLHHSWSPNGKTGWTPDPAPMATVGEYPWNTDEVRSSDAFLDGQNLRLYYAGHDLPDGTAPNLAIAEKTCDLAPD